MYRPTVINILTDHWESGLQQVVRCSENQKGKQRLRHLIEELPSGKGP